MPYTTNEHALEKAILNAEEAFAHFKKCSIKDRATLMRLIAKEIEDLGEILIDTAHEETNLPKARLVNEKGRTVFQWTSYADAIESGIVLDIRIDTALPERTPPRPDIRKIGVPLGVVAVFGASNFPFAFSTAGGDTASALAAGNSVIVKAHPAHPRTAQLMGDAISAGIQKAGLPTGVFSQVFGDERAGRYLVKHDQVKAIAFTGSFTAGKALFDLANKRRHPIPVFAEMGSVNPLFLLPNKLTESTTELANQYVASLTMGVGQFCTNPGILVVQESTSLEAFLQEVQVLISQSTAGKMLHDGISVNYSSACHYIQNQEGVELVATGNKADSGYGSPAVSKVSGKAFLANSSLSQEVFGPFGLIVVCQDQSTMEQVAQSLEGQLTVTLLATEKDMEEHLGLISILQEKCGRFSCNNFPTGVEVCFAMQHGGPFPASTDSRFTSVGADSIKRFMRPLSFQNWPERLLPLELQNENPLNLQRTINTINSNKSL